MRKSLVADEHIPAADALRAALDVAIERAPGRLVLAVSGGRDSMALLHAVALWFPESVAAVATFDHGSGAAATEAAALVAAEARRRGLTVIRERARSIEPTEDAWRTARWLFLKRVARGYGASVATAHTRDDQVETIVLRLLRGTGARGLAALAAPSTIVRPWLPIARREVAAWANSECVPFVEDPTNHTPQYFRSRVRMDLLPALEVVHPGFAQEMLQLADHAAVLRREVDALAAQMDVQNAPPGSPPGALRFQAASLLGMSAEGQAVMWPALFAKLGVALNRRGTAALVQFTNNSRIGTSLELAGKASVVRLRDSQGVLFEMRAAPGAVSKFEARGWQRPSLVASPNQALSLPKQFGCWRFSVSEAPEPAGPNAWLMPLVDGVPYEVRCWSAGDRIFTDGAPAGRRVARYLSEARVPPVDRPAWPVVLLEGDIVWVPGVCRSRAAPNRPGRPAVTWYRCEREHG